MKIWVLTWSVNEDLQFGSYFGGIWRDKPSVEQLNSELFKLGFGDNELKAQELYDEQVVGMDGRTEVCLFEYQI